MSSTTKSCVITRFKNASGTFSWRVSGWLGSVRIRKNFKSRDEAGAEQAALELRALQVTSGMRAATTFLTDAQLREAEDAFRRLAGTARTLLFCVDYTATNHRVPEQQKPLADAVTAYITAKQGEQNQNILSIQQFAHIRRHMTKLNKTFPGSSVSQFSSAQLIAYCARGNASLKTYNNRRGILSTFFKYAQQNDWAAINPILKVPYHRIARRRGSAKTLSASEAQELMAHVEEHHPAAVPFFALCLFAGIRPCLRTGEIHRLRPEHVRLDVGVIHVEPEVSKVREKRRVVIQENLAAWLKAYPLEKFPILIPNLQHIRAKLVEKFGLSHDVLRHTFISMFVGKFRSMGEAALQAGNSESIIRKHYLDLKSPEEAEQFFGIVPRAVAAAEKKNDIVSLASFGVGIQPISACGG